MFSSSAVLGCQNGAGTVTHTVSASSKSCWEVIFQCQDRQCTVAPDRSRTYWTHYSVCICLRHRNPSQHVPCVQKSWAHIWSSSQCFVTISPIKLHRPTAKSVSVNEHSTLFKQIRKSFGSLNIYWSCELYSMSIYTSSLYLYLSTRWVAVCVNMWHMDGLQVHSSTGGYFHLDYF